MTTVHKLTLPTIHLNGTSRERLIEQYTAAADAINDAYHALMAAAPNGRDYYPQGPQAMEAATREHIDRLSRLDAIHFELVELAEAIAAT